MGVRLRVVRLTVGVEVKRRRREKGGVRVRGVCNRVTDASTGISTISNLLL